MKQRLPYFTLLTFVTFSSLLSDTWKADNGNGTFTNPIFYDEFSDPDLIRVGEDYYLTGTTMHSMPGLPVLHSTDLVNWKLASYAMGETDLDLEARFRLEKNQDIYGRGIWAPCFRYHNGTFYIFSNVNGRKTQLFTATNPRGPWTHKELNIALHDLSVLFDDDGKIYVVWGYKDIEFAELDKNFEIIPGTHKILFENDAGMGEGSHFYKIGGKYYIISAWWKGRMRMPCARANHPTGPWEVNPEISADEEFGIPEGSRFIRDRSDDFELKPIDPKSRGRMAMHQGGVVDTPSGEWWGFSMMDNNSVGRLTCLSPVTWHDGWPYFGLPGNLGRTPRTWIKPEHPNATKPIAPYERNDDFDGPSLANGWQWNHVPVLENISLKERPGFLRLHALPVTDFWNARNTLTQRAIGPVSIPTALLHTDGMKPGDTAGLALLNHPYAWIAIHRTDSGFELQQYDRWTQKTLRRSFSGQKIYLRAHCDFLKEKAYFSFSYDNQTYEQMGDEWSMVYQGRTFQGVRYALFNYHTGSGEAGYADFDQFKIHEPFPSGFTRPIPYGQTVQFKNRLDDSFLSVWNQKLISIPSNTDARNRLKVVGLPFGRIALETPDGLRVTVGRSEPFDQISVRAAKENGDPSQTFQWMEMPYGQTLLMSLATHRYLRIQPNGGLVTADARGATFDHINGASFDFEIIPDQP